MSQVIVTEDKFRDKRGRSRQQEAKIEKDPPFPHWKMSDPTKPDPLPKIIGILLAPVLAVWGVILAFMAWALAVTLGAFRVLGAFWKKS